MKLSFTEEVHVKKKVVGKYSTEELFERIENSVRKQDYIFTRHGKMRSGTRRGVTENQIIEILKGKNKVHEKRKDKFSENFLTWIYHIRGKNIDKEKIRIALAFD